MVEFLKGSRISRCHGCKGQIFNPAVPPNDMVFMLHTKRNILIQRPGGVREWVESSNPSCTFYHFGTLECICKIRSTIEVDEINMMNENFSQLTPGHIGILQEKGYYTHIVNNQSMH